MGLPSAKDRALSHGLLAELSEGVPLRVRLGTRMSDPALATARVQSEMLNHNRQAMYQIFQGLPRWAPEVVPRPSFPSEPGHVTLPGQTGIHRNGRGYQYNGKAIARESLASL